MTALRFLQRVTEGGAMENTIEIQGSLEVSVEDQLSSNQGGRNKAVEQLSILDWYRILRAHHHWTVFQAIRFALWLAH
jgi:hypothetical protein